MRRDWTVAQRLTCCRFDTAFVPSVDEVIVGVARNVGSAVQPVNGLRHPPEAGTTGWYIWSGQDSSQDPDFFEPVCVSCLEDRCPLVLPYLALPPGWRFLLDDRGYEDVWLDESLSSSSPASRPRR